jgi:tetratricopeptide (TPR) repeat protein
MTAPDSIARKQGTTSLAIPLSLVLLLTVCFCLATHLDVWFQNWQGNRAGSANFLAVALGDARRMFAKDFFYKADAYFHSGFYPSIYDNRESYQTPHIAEDSGAMKGKNTGDEDTFLGPPRNWIDRFGRQFYPSVHTHLTEGGANGHEGQGTLGEMLPWLKLSQELDPKQVETYTTTAYWLRAMGNLNDAEAFLREGLKENPGSPQLLFDLGRLYFEFLHDPARARNVWEAALHNLANLPDAEKNNEENLYLKEQILGQYASLEEQAKDIPKAIQLLEQLKQIAPNPQQVQQRIDELKARTPAAKPN